LLRRASQGERTDGGHGGKLHSYTERDKASHSHHNEGGIKCNFLRRAEAEVNAKSSSIIATLAAEIGKTGGICNLNQNLSVLCIQWGSSYKACLSVSPRLCMSV
jgi:hypothetical protein